jgi:hypothetical protein
VEVAQRTRVNVYAANATPIRLQVANDLFITVKAFGTATQPAAEMKVFEHKPFGHVHRGVPFTEGPNAEASGP